MIALQTAPHNKETRISELEILLSDALTSKEEELRELMKWVDDAESTKTDALDKLAKAEQMVEQMRKSQELGAGPVVDNLETEMVCKLAAAEKGILQMETDHKARIDKLETQLWVAKRKVDYNAVVCAPHCLSVLLPPQDFSSV